MTAYADIFFTRSRRHFERNVRSVLILALGAHWLAWSFLVSWLSCFCITLLPCCLSFRFSSAPSEAFRLTVFPVCQTSRLAVLPVLIELPRSSFFAQQLNLFSRSYTSTSFSQVIFTNIPLCNPPVLTTFARPPGPWSNHANHLHICLYPPINHSVRPNRTDISWSGYFNNYPHIHPNLDNTIKLPRYKSTARSSQTTSPSNFLTSFSIANDRIHKTKLANPIDSRVHRIFLFYTQLLTHQSVNIEIISQDAEPNSPRCIISISSSALAEIYNWRCVEVNHVGFGVACLSYKSFPRFVPTYDITIDNPNE